MSVQTFAGFATTDARENGVRPRAFYRQCKACGTQRLVLGNVDDAEGLCRSVLRSWLRGRNTAARVGETGPPVADGALDAGDALAWLQERIWQLYTKWEPTRNPSFTSWASDLLGKGMGKWSIEASGEPEHRTNGRRHPKAHAASVSTSYDRLVDGEDGDTLGSFLADTVEMVTSLDHLDALRRAPLDTRRVVLLLHCGYSQAEAARRIGVSQSHVGNLIRDLRADVEAGR